MGVIIGAFVWLGVWLDDNYMDGKDVYKIVFSLVGVFLALGSAIVQILKMSKDEDNE